ncbi:unnamed protein product [Staurois parvus]|uniref:Uncharacterized protein n=1 Tax=Staurois parvus TaxID=386267 RepID=A0ABN9GLN8_9NEOB|nr:unnamed protein product [Staurois parvus]
MGPLCPCLNSKKPMKKRYQGHLMGPPTDPGPSGKGVPAHSRLGMQAVSGTSIRGGLTTHGAPGQ